MTAKIVIRERGDSYMAFIDGHPEIWGSGKVVASAVGDLVLSHQEVCDVKIEYERDYERLKKGLEMEQKTEPERLKIGQGIICPKHGVQVIDAIDDSVPQQILYILTCGCETRVEKKSSSIGRRKGPVHRSPKIRVLANAKIEMGDLILEIDYKDSSGGSFGGFRKKVVIFEIKHGKFQIEQNQLRRYCFMINNPGAYFPKADEVKVIFMMFDRINTMKCSAYYSIHELDKELATKILENSALSEVYSLAQDSNMIESNITEGLKMIME